MKFKEREMLENLPCRYNTSEVIRPPIDATARNIIVPNRIPPLKRVKPKHKGFDQHEISLFSPLSSSG